MCWDRFGKSSNGARYAAKMIHLGTQRTRSDKTYIHDNDQGPGLPIALPDRMPSDPVKADLTTLKIARPSNSSS